jgi:hypothetical protein
MRDGDEAGVAMAMAALIKARGAEVQGPWR